MLCIVVDLSATESFLKLHAIYHIHQDRRREPIVNTLFSVFYLFYFLWQILVLCIVLLPSEKFFPLAAIEHLLRHISPIKLSNNNILYYSFLLIIINFELFIVFSSKSLVSLWYSEVVSDCKLTGCGFNPLLPKE